MSRDFTWLYCAKKAKQIMALIVVETLGDPENTVLDRGPDPPTARGGEAQPLPNNVGHVYNYTAAF